MNFSNLMRSIRKINYRDRKVQAGIVILLLGVAGVYGWVTQLYQPAEKKLTDLQTEVAAKQQKLNTIRAMKPQLERIRAEIVAKGLQGSELVLFQW